MADRVVGALVVGVGASTGASAAEVLDLVEEVLRDAGLSPDAVAALATVDAKVGEPGEPGIVRAAERLGVPLVAYSAAELAAVRVPNPSEVALAAVGTPSVAEAAALVGGGELLVAKRKSGPVDGRAGRVTCAVATAGPGFAGPGGGRHDDHHDHDHDHGRRPAPSASEETP